MKIESLAQLNKLLILCRKQGVNIIKVDGMEIVLEGTPEIKVLKARSATVTPGGITEETQVPQPDVVTTPEALTEEQLLFYSAEAN